MKLKEEAAKNQITKFKLQAKLQYAIYKRSPAAFKVTFFSPEGAQAIGAGYHDCTVSHKSKYGYYFRYQMPNGRFLRLPKEGPFTFEYNPYIRFPSPVISK